MDVEKIYPINYHKAEEIKNYHDYVEKTARKHKVSEYEATQYLLTRHAGQYYGLDDREIDSINEYYYNQNVQDRIKCCIGN